MKYTLSYHGEFWLYMNRSLGEVIRWQEINMQHKKQHNYTSAQNHLWIHIIGISICNMILKWSSDHHYRDTVIYSLWSDIHVMNYVAYVIADLYEVSFTFNIWLLRDKKKLIWKKHDEVSDDSFLKKLVWTSALKSTLLCIIIILLHKIVYP